MRLVISDWKHTMILNCERQAGTCFAILNQTEEKREDDLKNGNEGNDFWFVANVLTDMLSAFSTLDGVRYALRHLQYSVASRFYPGLLLLLSLGNIFPSHFREAESIPKRV